jgi:hypothetical protein
VAAGCRLPAQSGGEQWPLRLLAGSNALPAATLPHRNVDVPTPRAAGTSGGPWVLCPPPPRYATGPSGQPLPCALPFQYAGALHADCLSLEGGREVCRDAAGALRSCLPRDDGVAAPVGGSGLAVIWMLS